MCSDAICVQPATRHNFESYMAAAECIAGDCWGGVCRCTGQADCAADRGANWYWPFGGDGVGRPDIVIGYYCGY